MKISISNKNLNAVAEFLNGLNVKGQLSLARSRLLALIDKKQTEFLDDRKSIVESFADKDSEGQPIVKDDGNIKLSKKATTEANKELLILLDEVSVIEYGEYTSKLSKLEGFLKEYDEEISGAAAQGFFVLVDAFENKEEK